MNQSPGATAGSDSSVIAQILAGDSQAYARLVDRYGPALFRFCRVRLGNDAEAEDAVQDVLWRAFRALTRFRLGQPFPAWLFAIAANRVKTRYQAHGRDQALFEAVTREERTRRRPDAEAAALDALVADQLRAAIGRLPATLRLSVELFYFSGLPVKEAARVVGVGSEAFKSRLLRARRRLEKILGTAPQPDGESEGM